MSDAEARINSSGSRWRNVHVAVRAIKPKGKGERPALHFTPTGAAVKDSDFQVVSQFEFREGAASQRRKQANTKAPAKKPAVSPS